MLLMIINAIELHNFRNYGDCSVELDKGLNVICGNNAVGKTNLVESIYYASFGKSPRTNKEKELIRWGSDSLNVKLAFTKRFRSYNISIGYDGKARKYYIDKLPITRISDIIGLLNVVFFSPDELSIVKDGPSERRRFLDMSISQQKKSYFTDLVTYNKVLEQRNKLLKSHLSTKEIDDVLVIYNIQLSKFGARIINNRYIFIEHLREIAGRVHQDLTSGSEILGIDYESAVSRGSVSAMESELLQKLTDGSVKDKQLQYTTVGPHRDDIALSIGGVDVRKFGSQGQQRTAALSLKLSEIQLIEEENGELPILILDDVLSELDEYRAGKLLAIADRTQTVLTCTEFNGKCDRLIRIDNGAIVEMR